MKVAFALTRAFNGFLALWRSSPAPNAPAIEKAILYQGIFARVARQLGLGPSGRSHVYRVAIGKRQSPRVMNALLSEIERIERAERKAAA